MYSESPTITALTQFKIGTGTTEPTDTDKDVESVISGWNEGTDAKDYVAGYPSFGTGAGTVTTRGFVASTQGTGNAITEVGEFNEDASPVMFSRNTFTAINKTNQQEIAFIFEYEIEE